MDPNTDDQVISGHAAPPPENWGDPNAPDIMAAMDQFFEQEGNPLPDPVAPEPQKAVPDAPVTPKEAREEELPDIDPDFFPDATTDAPDDKPVDPPVDGFDEVAFDKQTEEEVKGMDVKAGEKFRALKAELKEAKKVTVTPEIQAKLKELEIKAAEVEGLKERMVSLSSQSAKLQMENEPAYQDQVVKPAETLFTNADKLSGSLGLEPEVLRAIIRERDLETQETLMEEHFGSKSLLVQSKVAKMAEDFNSLVSKREEMFSDAETRIEKMRAERIDKDRRLLDEQRRVVQTFQKQRWEDHKDLIPGFVEDGEETEAYKRLMKRGLSIDFGTARAEDQAAAAFAGTVLPHLIKQVRELQNSLAAYVKDDKKALKSRPGAGASVTAPNATKAPKNFDEAMAADYNFTS